jgi:hypothetical protein
MLSESTIGSILFNSQCSHFVLILEDTKSARFCIRIFLLLLLYFSRYENAIARTEEEMWSIGKRF